MLSILLHTFFDQSYQESCLIVLQNKESSYFSPPSNMAAPSLLPVHWVVTNHSLLHNAPKLSFLSWNKGQTLPKIYKTFHSSWPWDFLNLFPIASLFHSDFNTRPPCGFPHIMDPSVSESLLSTFPLSNSALPGSWRAHRLTYFTLLNYLLHESFLDTQN